VARKPSITECLVPDDLIQKLITKLKNLEELWQIFIDTIAINGDVEKNAYRLLVAAAHDKHKNAASDPEVDHACLTVEKALDVRNRLGCLKSLCKERIFPKDFVADFRKIILMGVCGSDDEERPIIYLGLGKLKISLFKSTWDRLNSEGTGDDRDDRNLITLWYLQMMDYIMQVRLPELSKRKGKTVTQVSMIVDVNGLSLGIYCNQIMAWLKAVSSLGNVLFGEMLHQVYIVNVPWICIKLWSIVQKFVHPLTAAKFHLLSAKDTHKMLQVIPARAVPTLVDGTFPVEDVDITFGVLCKDYPDSAEESKKDIPGSSPNRTELPSDAGDHLTPQPPSKESHSKGSSEESPLHAPTDSTDENPVHTSAGSSSPIKAVSEKEVFTDCVENEGYPESLTDVSIVNGGSVLGTCSAMLNRAVC